MPIPGKMFYLKTIIPVIACLLFSCKSPSEKAVEDFKKVNESLQQTQKAIDSTGQKFKFTGVDAAIADSLKHLFAKAYSFMDRLKYQLDSMDHTGDDPDAAENLIIKTPAGDSLYYYVMGIGNTAIQYGDSSLRKFYIGLKTNGKRSWLTKYFKDIPTIAARTILSKFQHDIMAMKRSLTRAS